MRVLSLETSGRTSTLATHVVDRGRLELIRETALPAHLRTAQGLAPAMQELLAESRWRPADVTLVAVSIGPGSFTGLRIGVTAAKTFAYAVGARVLGVATLHVIAEQARVAFESITGGIEEAAASSRVICPAINAERGQVFAGRYDHSGRDALVLIGDVQILDVATWNASLQPGDLVTGPALSKFTLQLPDHVHRTAESVWQPRAPTVGELAWRDYSIGRRDDVWQLVPQYHRLSAAEEKRKK